MRVLFPNWESSSATRWIKEWKFKAKMEIYGEKIDFPQLRISELDIWPFFFPPGSGSMQRNDKCLYNRHKATKK